MITWREDVGDDRKLRLGFIQADNSISEDEVPQVGTVGSRGAVGVHRDEVSHQPSSNVQTRKSMSMAMDANDDRHKYSKEDTNMIDRGQKAVGSIKKQVRKRESQKRQSYAKDRDARDAKGKYSLINPMPQYLPKRKENRTGS